MNKNRPMVTALLLAALLFLPSCFTMGLWGFFAEREPDMNGREQTAFAYDNETEWSWADLCLRLLLTPLTVGLDCLTAPVQVWFLDLGDDDDCESR